MMDRSQWTLFFAGVGVLLLLVVIAILAWYKDRIDWIRARIDTLPNGNPEGLKTASADLPDETLIVAIADVKATVVTSTADIRQHLARESGVQTSVTLRAFRKLDESFSALRDQNSAEHSSFAGVARWIAGEVKRIVERLGFLARKDAPEPPLPPTVKPSKDDAR